MSGSTSMPGSMPMPMPGPVPSRRRGGRRLLPLAAVAVALLAGAVLPAPASGRPDPLAEGRSLFESGCASCHGTDGQGAEGPDGGIRGPSLQASGEAAAYYELSTGRMPLGNSDEQPRRKEPAYDDDEIDALVAYVGSLGDGPALPAVDPAAGDVAAGGEVFRGNCQACHSASGAGGALSYGRAAPNLHPATPLQIAAAVRAGPGQMPVFGPDVLDDGEVADVIAYVRYLRDPADPGGLPIGRTGPIPEGFVAWLIGMVALLALVAWIGTRSPAVPDEGGADVG